MKTETLRDLRYRYTEMEARLGEGEEIEVPSTSASGSWPGRKGSQFVRSC